MYPCCDVDKVRERGETWPVDPEMREALDQLGANLRGEVRSVDAGLREALNEVVVDLRGEVRSVDAGLREALNQVVVDLRGEIRSGDAETREVVNSLSRQIQEQIHESEEQMRLHFDVVGESLRGDIRAVAEGMVASREQTDRRIDEQAGRTEGLESRVVRLEVRVTDLKDGRKPRRPRRRR
jgi:hypothetical protein